MIKKLTWLIALGIILTLIVFPVTAQDGGDDETPVPTPQGSMSLADTLVSLSETGDEFGLFVEALEETRLDLTLHTGGPFTVFAPTDEAISTYLRAQGLDTGQFLANPQLVRQILLYHVIPGRFLSRNLVNYDRGSMATALPGTALDLTMLADTLYINESRVIGTDIVATNGVIFTIDSILLPPESGLVITAPPSDEDTSEDTTDATPEPLFTLNLLTERSELEGFVTAIQSSPPMTGLVNGDGPFTIFAPTDAGFGNALQILGISGDDLVADTERLNTTLFYHVIPIVLSPQNLADLDGVYIGTTAQGVAVKVNVVDGETYVNRGRISDNLIASNGAIFVVDFLLLEPDSALTRQAIEALNEADAAAAETESDAEEIDNEENTDENTEESDDTTDDAAEDASDPAAEDTETEATD
jgi:uncharacterized surface protein with fasciclin (FAS1) repeats